MVRYRFTGRYETTATILTGEALPGEAYRRRETGEPVAGSGRLVEAERIHHGRQFHADAGDVVDLTEEQAAYIERDAPGIIERLQVVTGSVRAVGVTTPARARKRRR